MRVCALIEPRLVGSLGLGGAVILLGPGSRFHGVCVQLTQDVLDDSVSLALAALLFFGELSLPCLAPWVEPGGMAAAPCIQSFGRGNCRPRHVQRFWVFDWQGGEKIAELWACLIRRVKRAAGRRVPFAGMAALPRQRNGRSGEALLGLASSRFAPATARIRWV